MKSNNFKSSDMVHEVLVERCLFAIFFLVKRGGARTTSIGGYALLGVTDVGGGIGIGVLDCWKSNGTV